MKNHKERYVKGKLGMRCATVLMTASALVSVSGVHAAETLSEALRESKLLLDWRLRYEGVDQSAFTEQADALTNRVRVGVQTGEWGRTSLLAEAVSLQAVSGDYNDTLNGNSQYPVVADPDNLATINRFAITNKSLEKTALTFGRQRIILDDSRFVGNVGWRQNEQTFDGLRAVIGGTDSVRVDLSYISQVNRIFGPDSPAGKFHGDILLANASKSFGFGTLTGFLYSLDLDEAAGLSTNTAGVRLTGTRAINAAGLTALYTVSVARQTDNGANSADLSELYLNIEGGLRFGKATVALGIEQLGSDGVNRVTTPLATLHAFQGWADKFLATPVNGIDDSFVRFGWAAGSAGPFTAVNLAALYHDFDADFGSAHYGDEVDIMLNARTERTVFTLKYAAYNADQFSDDTDKLWLSVDFSF